MTNEIKGLIGSISLSRDYILFMQYCEKLEDTMACLCRKELSDFKRMKEEDLIGLHHNLGAQIRYDNKLWEADLENHPDDVSMAVIYYVHYTMNDGKPLRLSELRDAKIDYEVNCRIDISELSEEDKEKIQMAKQTVSNMYDLNKILNRED